MDLNEFGEMAPVDVSVQLSSRGKCFYTASALESNLNEFDEMVSVDVSVQLSSRS